MLRIVIVDDEQIVLDGIKTVLESANKDWHVVGTAMNGVQGLNEIRCQKPDVVITDIKMPDMDGLEMSKLLKEEFPDIVVFVFSGYAEFNLAQKAIDLGVYNYLLKPINYEEIYTALEKAQEFIEERRRFRLEHEEQIKKLKTSIPILKEKLLFDLIHGTTSTNDGVFYKLKYLNLSIKNTLFAVLKIDDFELITKDYSIEDKYLLLFAVRNITEEICSQYSKEFFVLNDSDDSICIIMNNQKNDKSFIMALCEDIRENIHTHLRETVSIGIGRFVERLEELQLAYSDGLMAIQGSLFKSKNVTVHIEEILESIPPASYSIAMEKSIINAVKSGDYQLTLKEFDIIAKHLNTSSLEYIKRVCYEIYVSLNRSLYESGINTEDILRDKYDIFSKLSNCTYTKEVFILVSNVFKLLAENVSNQKQSHRTKIVGAVIKYMEENFSNNISLKEASEKVYLNINYLSEIFKAEIGENFTEYLKKLRVRKAINLLSRLDLKIYQISEMVGYSDPKHFSQVFKEITGVSPKDYKVNCKGL